MRFIYYLMIFVLFLILRRVWVFQTENEDTPLNELKKEQEKQNAIDVREEHPGRYIRKNNNTGSSNNNSGSSNNNSGSGAGTTRRSY